MNLGISPLSLTSTLRNRHLRASDPILALFANGEQGAIIDPSSGSVAYQTTAKETLAGDSDPYGYAGDQSGNDSHATQADAASRPLREQASGLWRARFDGSDDYWSIDSVAPIARGQQSFSVYVVGEITDGFLWSFGDGSEDGTFVGLRVQSGVLRSQRNDGAVNENDGLINPAPTGIHVYGLEYDGTTVRFYLDDDAPIEVDQGADIGSGIDRFSVGALVRTGVIQKGDLGAYGIVVREGVFTSAERAIVQQWCAERGGIAL